MKKDFLLGLLLTAIMAFTNFACGSTEDGKNSNRRSSTANQTAPEQQGQTNQNPSNQNPTANVPNNNRVATNQIETPPSTVIADPKTAAFDLQFLDTMIAHHQGTVVLAKSGLQKSDREELKTLALNIVTTREKEISQMRDWREKWFAGKPLAVNLEMPGMIDSMKGFDMNKLASVSGKDFNLAFIDMMISHHEGAMALAKDALERAEKPEIKTLARGIIMAQEAEIKSMRDWKESWAKRP